MTTITQIMKENGGRIPDFDIMIRFIDALWYEYNGTATRNQIMAAIKCGYHESLRIAQTLTYYTINIDGDDFVLYEDDEKVHPRNGKDIVEYSLLPI